ncbi:MAG: sigma-70 family RNA polymerase sigma factor [Deltaproteobacteria bacterium]|nr:sigma-70 family RNA polymerase sigma factor [Deltaproteobacteria bacterium]
MTDSSFPQPVLRIAPDPETPPQASPQETHVHLRVVDHLFRHDAGQMVSTLTRAFGLPNLSLAEDVVQEAFIAALKNWPFQGVPENPAAWVLRVARNKALDVLRRQGNWKDKSPAVQSSFRTLEGMGSSEEPRFAQELRDDRLRLMFACCHPCIPQNSRTALILKTVGGFSTSEIGRAFLTRGTTIAQRLVRAKRHIRSEGLRLEIPSSEQLPELLPNVLEVLYLMFNEGYSSHQGEALVRRELCSEAIRLCELLAEHPATQTPETEALAALFLLQGARLPARSDGDGDLILLPMQDRRLWNAEMIGQGLEYLGRSARGQKISTYHLQAEIAACHAMATDYENTDWASILRAYDDLQRLTPSPVIALNRAVALAEVKGPKAALEILEKIQHQPTMADYYPLHASLGALYKRLGKRHLAQDHFRRALELTISQPVRRFLLDQLHR